MAVQTPDAAALAAAAAAARAADIDAASMHIFAALRAAPGPRPPSLQSTVEFAALVKAASSVEAKHKELHDRFPLVHEAIAERHVAPSVTPPPRATLSDLGPFLLTLTDGMLTTTLRFVEELGPALASWGERSLVLSENFDHELAIRVRLGLLGPIVLDPLEYSFEIMPVAALALHAILALCTVYSSPELQDLYTYLNRLKLQSPT